jgi:hypothetical protein
MAFSLVWVANLSDFSRSPSPKPVHADEKAGNGLAWSPLKVTTELQDPMYSPPGEIPAYQPTKAGEAKTEQPQLAVVTLPQDIPPMAPLDLLSPVIDPALMQTNLPPRQDISPVMMGKRPMPPAMHRLNTNVSLADSVPSSVASSPETPLNMHFGLYSNNQAQSSYEDLSRVNSRTDLSTCGARKGTNTSASSDDDLVHGGGDQGGVPAPKAKKSHARKVTLLVIGRGAELTISNPTTISSELEMPSSYSGSTLPIPA